LPARRHRPLLCQQRTIPTQHKEHVMLKKLIEQLRAAIAAKLAERKKHQETISQVRQACEQAENRAPSEDEAEQVRTAQAAITAIDAELETMRSQLDQYEDEQRRDEAADRLAREVQPGAPAPSNQPETARVGAEPRTYARETDPKGIQFLRDVAQSYIFRDPGAADRLSRHMQEERVERGEQLVDRATGTSNFSGLVVPQYLVDLVAPHAKAGRPFADVCRGHDLPAQGMQVHISKITTGSSTAVQAAQGDTVSETDIDDTLESPSVQTNAGSQSVARQALERGAGIEDTTLEDLFRSYGTTLDSTLLNQATNGLTNVATAVTYTDASPTAAELYPKLLQAASAVEAALLDMDPNDAVVVMHSRRWYWLQSQLSSTWPLFGQPGIGAQQGGVNYAEAYGSGFRGLLPNGTPVVVDNNIATNLGAGTNEDEIYVGARSEYHLWEDPAAPMLIKAEQNQAKKLLVDFVVYGYFAYTHKRRSHAQKIGGTGLVTPTF
jgi:hypothetical protein